MAEDEDMKILLQYAETEWPNDKMQVREGLRAYWPYRDEVHAEEGLLLRSNRLIVPRKLRPEMLRLLHASHGGIEKTKHRAREVLYWPGLDRDIEEAVQQCKVCKLFQHQQPREPLQCYPIPTGPWQNVAMDLFQHQGKHYLILVDYYSFFYEVHHMNKTTAQSLLNSCAATFALHGLPVQIVTDNGPPFNSAVFASYCEQHSISHVTSSPYYPRSNGMAERGVQEAKKLMNKHPFGSQQYFDGLLEWRNTPRDGILKSPVQRLMNRHTRAQVPAHPSFLQKSSPDPKAVTEKLLSHKRQQAKYYDRGTVPLPDLKPGEPVYVRNQASHQWAPAIVLTRKQPRSYIVQDEDGIQHQRNRVVLRHSARRTKPPARYTDPNFTT